MPGVDASLESSGGLRQPRATLTSVPASCKQDFTIAEAAV
jgi:hypothetical protein